jgi:glycosyltransferase involved in cell wall biosynthesis
MASAPIIFNGKFLSARPTGVHRVAGELISHIDRLLAARPGADGRWSIICPRDAHGSLPLEVIQRRQAGVLTWQTWEQFELPFLARGAVLVNLCNLAPLAHRHSVTLIHDAQVFLTPESYSTAFRTWYRFALPRIGAGAAQLVTVSDYSRDRLAEAGVAPRNRISVIANGVDHLHGVAAEPEILERLRLTSGRYVVGAANAQSHKNVALLFAAFAEPGMENLTLVLVGADGAAAFAAAGAPAPPGVVFAGRVSDGELRALYEQAACLAFPSTTEGFGLPPLEAMACGTPVVTSNVSSLPEVVGDAAVLVNPENVFDIARGIREVLLDDALRERLIRRGFEQAARFSWERTAREVLEIYLEAVE